MQYLWQPPPPYSVPIQGQETLFPVHRIFCVGRNYQAHALEMGKSVDKSTSTPFYFTKSPTALVHSKSHIPYPPGTHNLHHEMELVVAIGGSGFQLTSSQAAGMVYGYACGLDLTRRDLQAVAKEKSLPWDLGKDFENAAVISDIVCRPNYILDKGRIDLRVNGILRQDADISQLIWSIPEIIEDLSKYYHLQPGDLIYTGTPEGVSALKSGDFLVGSIEGLGTVELSIA
ncbi:MAG: fumarylacetoacetate hydrolase family protein [Gammaproteobacteria bacterium]|nr:fumarylacetoacetate hydrolase family protein [Gammaproteobacteria bacterium]